MLCVWDTLFFCNPAGPPDVEQACEPSVRTWSPNAGIEQGVVGLSECPLQGCMLQLQFAYPLVPDSLTVWVTFFSPEETALPAIHNILLLTVSGNNISLGPSNVFCDTPLTLKLDIEEEVYGVQFFTMEQHLEIDATLLASKQDCLLCRHCQPLHYRLLRQPPFTHAPHDLLLNEPTRRYTDRWVTWEVNIFIWKKVLHHSSLFATQYILNGFLLRNSSSK